MRCSVDGTGATSSCLAEPQMVQNQTRGKDARTDVRHVSDR